MFPKVALLSLALAFVASASPVANDNLNGLRIPIHKRSSVTKADGSFDREAALKEKVKVQNKHRQNLITINNKVGLQSFNKGAYIPELAALPASLRKRQSESLDDQSSNTEWTGTVSIGTPAQTFTIDFDTGSADLWVPASNCSGCKAQHSYDSSSSSTSQEQSGTFQIQYGDGSTASGPIYSDTVSVAGVSVTGQYLSAVTSESGDLVGGPNDGLMGMAFPAISQLNSVGLDCQVPYPMLIDMDRTPTSGPLSTRRLSPRECSITFKLSSSGSELYIGGTDDSLYSGDIEYHDLSSSNQGYWQISGASAVVGGNTTVSNLDTIIDTGTTIMYGPPDSVKQFYAAIDGASEYDSENGYYSIPCDSIPTIAFSWGGSNWDISSDTFNLGTTSDGNCQGALAAQDLGLGDNVWLLGDTLLMNVYSAFDVDNNAIGFASLS
ncbi:acid protease [Daedalea quercina L-15889]|uniref:Acid protease n=1 Tax=Daedalea quercina L-15889 TaxID=1314783 RepID=A0A165QQD7_9APHY|nr:acid protease [Daedalea quercina L-15889]